MNSLLKSNVLFHPIGSFISELGEQFFEISNSDADLLVFKSINASEGKNYVPITFVFWLKDSRISVFINDREVIDEYLQSESQAEDLKNCLRVLLSNKVIQTRSFSKEGHLKKETLTYKLLANEKEDEVSELIVNKLTFPWTKLKKEIQIYDSWL